MDFLAVEDDRLAGAVVEARQHHDRGCRIQLEDRSQAVKPFRVGETQVQEDAIALRPDERDSFRQTTRPGDREGSTTSLKQLLHKKGVARVVLDKQDRAPSLCCRFAFVLR